MLRAGPAAPLARGRPLPALRRCRDRPRRPGRRPAAPAALPLCGVWRPLRRPDRHRPGRPPPAPPALGAVPVPDGPEPLQPADRPGAGPRRLRRAGHDRGAAAGAHRQAPAGDPSGRGRDRRGLRGSGPQREPGRGRQRGRPARRRRLRGAPGRGTLAKDKPPVLGLLQRGGEVAVRMLADVRQATIRPVIEGSVAKGALVHTDGYGVHGRLDERGYGHKTVCHARGEYARDGDGDGFCELHVDPPGGFWSLPRSWLRPHRGISREKLPAYPGFFQLVHDARCRGKAPLGTLVAGLVAQVTLTTPERDKSLTAI